MGKALGALAGITAWLGWLTVCPALGFPSLATAAMLNLVVVPRQDPGFWLGWALLVLGLAAFLSTLQSVAYPGAEPFYRLRPLARDDRLSFVQTLTPSAVVELSLIHI